jgi:serine/threonine protein kinase
MVTSAAARQQNVVRWFTSVFVTAPLTVNFTNVQVHEVLHEGLASSVCRASVGGLVMAMKTIVVPHDNARQHKEMINAILIAESLSVHDNIVRHLGHDMRTFDCCRQFMSFYTGTLMALLASTPTLTVLQLADIAVQVARGMAFVHANGIIHRDLKCENVMIETVRIDENAEPQQVYKLGDLLECCTVTDHCAHRANVGTLGFMAPEVFSKSVNECVYTQACDVWSFGMLLYQLMTRQFPPPEATQTGDRPRLPVAIDVAPQLLPFSVLYEKCTEQAASERLPATSVVNFLQAQLRRASGPR